MRRAIILLTTAAVALIVGGGVAVAATIICHGGNCFGTNRADSIFGTNRHDAIFAKNGADFVTGNRADDNLNGQDGNDRVLGGLGNDWVKGGRNNDTVKGDDGHDRITGGPGHNVIRAGDHMRDLIICGHNSRNFIYYDPRLDRFRNCHFLRRSLQTSSQKKHITSVTALGPSLDFEAQGSEVLVHSRISHIGQDLHSVLRTRSASGRDLTVSRPFRTVVSPRPSPGSTLRAR
jgi:Ca2+-binding RTX toxin-like protein